MRKKSGKTFSLPLKNRIFQEDLEWALFHVAEMAQMDSSNPSKDFRELFSDIDSILPEIANLKSRFEALLSSCRQDDSCSPLYVLFSTLNALFPHLNIPQQRRNTLQLPALLSNCHTLLSAMKGIFKVDFRLVNPTTTAEALLIEFVKKAAKGKVSLARVAFQMELSCKAYGIEERNYSEEAVAKRYRRFKEADNKKSDKIGEILRDFLARKSSSEHLNLIAYFYKSYSEVVRLEAMGKPGS